MFSSSHAKKSVVSDAKASDVQYKERRNVNNEIIEVTIRFLNRSIDDAFVEKLRLFIINSELDIGYVSKEKNQIAICSLYKRVLTTDNSNEVRIPLTNADVANLKIQIGHFIGLPQSKMQPLG